jgi:FK506-binding protein 15
MNNNQIVNQMIPNQNQLAIFKPQTPNNMIFYPQMSQMDPNVGQLITQHPQQQQQQHKQNTTVAENNSPVVLAKLELINEKLEQLKVLSNQNIQSNNLPSMETSILLHNIQRIVKENEQYKKELYEKSSKIEEQNQKITDLLLKAQTYVEQSHQYLESKNSSFQSNAERNQQRLLELEQDKMNLTSELTKMTGQVSELNLEINRLKKDDLEMRQHLGEVSKNTDSYKQTNERLLVENSELQTKLDNTLNDLKKEKQLRKNMELKLQSNEEELNELKQNFNQSQKLVEEKRKKLEQDRVLFDNEQEEVKRTHEIEINQLKEKLNRIKSNASESQAEQIKQIEADLTREWQSKLDQTVATLEQKNERKLQALNEENAQFKKQSSDLNEQLRNLKLNLSTKQRENEELKQSIEDLSEIKLKYETFQSKVLIMKEKYEAKIKELVDAEPDSEVIGEEVKKIMNAMYKKIKVQIKQDQFYSGNGILTAMLKIIKLVTLQMFNQEEKAEEDGDIDYFSQHIYSKSFFSYI